MADNSSVLVVHDNKITLLPCVGGDADVIVVNKVFESLAREAMDPVDGGYSLTSRQGGVTVSKSMVALFYALDPSRPGEEGQRFDGEGETNMFEVDVDEMRDLYDQGLVQAFDGLPTLLLASTFHRLYSAQADVPGVLECLQGRVGVFRKLVDVSERFLTSEFGLWKTMLTYVSDDQQLVSISLDQLWSDSSVDSLKRLVDIHQPDAPGSTPVEPFWEHVAKHTQSGLSFLSEATSNALDETLPLYAAWKLLRDAVSLDRANTLLNDPGSGTRGLHEQCGMDQLTRMIADWSSDHGKEFWELVDARPLYPRFLRASFGNGLVAWEASDFGAFSAIADELDSDKTLQAIVCMTTAPGMDALDTRLQRRCVEAWGSETDFNQVVSGGKFSSFVETDLIDSSLNSMCEWDEAKARFRQWTELGGDRASMASSVENLLKCQTILRLNTRSSTIKSAVALWGGTDDPDHGCWVSLQLDDFVDFLDATALSAWATTEVRYDRWKAIKYGVGTDAVLESRWDLPIGKAISNQGVHSTYTDDTELRALVILYGDHPEFWDVLEDKQWKMLVDCAGLGVSWDDEMNRYGCWLHVTEAGTPERARSLVGTNPSLFDAAVEDPGAQKMLLAQLRLMGEDWGRAAEPEYLQFIMHSHQTDNWEQHYDVWKPLTVGAVSESALRRRGQLLERDFAWIVAESPERVNKMLQSWGDDFAFTPEVRALVGRGMERDQNGVTFTRDAMDQRVVRWNRWAGKMDYDRLQFMLESRSFDQSLDLLDRDVVDAAMVGLSDIHRTSTDWWTEDLMEFCATHMPRAIVFGQPRIDPGIDFRAKYYAGKSGLDNSADGERDRVYATDGEHVWVLIFRDVIGPMLETFGRQLGVIFTNPRSVGHLRQYPSLMYEILVRDGCEFVRMAPVDLEGDFDDYFTLYRFNKTSRRLENINADVEDIDDDLEKAVATFSDTIENSVGLLVSELGLSIKNTIKSTEQSITRIQLQQNHDIDAIKASTSSCPEIVTNLQTLQAQQNDIMNGVVESTRFLKTLSLDTNDKLTNLENNFGSIALKQSTIIAELSNLPNRVKDDIVRGQLQNQATLESVRAILARAQQEDARTFVLLTDGQKKGVEMLNDAISAVSGIVSKIQEGQQTTRENVHKLSTAVNSRDTKAILSLVQSLSHDVNQYRLPAIEKQMERYSTALEAIPGIVKKDMTAIQHEQTRLLQERTDFTENSRVEKLLEHMKEQQSQQTELIAQKEVLGGVLGDKLKEVLKLAMQTKQHPPCQDTEMLVGHFRDTKREIGQRFVDMKDQVEMMYDRSNQAELRERIVTLEKTLLDAYDRVILQNTTDVRRFEIEEEDRWKLMNARMDKTDFDLRKINEALARLCGIMDASNRSSRSLEKLSLDSTRETVDAVLNAHQKKMLTVLTGVTIGGVFANWQIPRMANRALERSRSNKAIPDDKQ